MASSVLETLSNELSSAAEAVGGSVVAIYGRRWMPSSGIQWRKGVIVTAHHTIRREEDITVAMDVGETVKASVAGRDPSTDLAILKLPEGTSLALPAFGDAPVKLGHFALALGRSRSSTLVASAGIVGGLSGEWQPRRGGRVDQHIRLDLELYPGFSGGPLVNAQGKVIGINTRGLARGRGVTIPLTTVNRVVDELLEKGHIARPYLGLAMQPVDIPEALGAKLKAPTNRGLLVVHVESGGPAEKADLLIGDILVALRDRTLQESEGLHSVVLSSQIGETLP